MPKTSTSGQGRPKGALNKTTVDIKALAQSYGPSAIANLAEMAGLIRDESGKPIGRAAQEATRVAATKELLDRGFGRARQPVSGPDADDDAAQPLQIVYRWAAKDE